jgi:nicotinamidase-related amidase
MHEATAQTKGSTMRVTKQLAALTLLVAASGAWAQSGKKAPESRILTPQNSAVVLIDHQPQMAFAVQSIDRTLLVNNVTGLAKAAKVFNVPTIITSVAEKSFSGPIFPEVQAVFPNLKPIDRTSMNSWDDKRFVEAVKKTGRRKLVMAALWTEVCLTMPALDALAEGYEVYVVTDASGGVSKEAHDAAIARLVQAGATPVTWLQVLLEYQRDWARQDTYAATLDVVRSHGGAYGVGVNYAKTMLGPNASEGHSSR